MRKLWIIGPTLAATAFAILADMICPGAFGPVNKCLMVCMYVSAAYALTK